MFKFNTGIFCNYLFSDYGLILAGSNAPPQMHHSKQFQLRIQHKMVSKREVYRTDKRKTLSSYLESKSEGALETRKPSEISDIFPQSLQDDDSLTSKDGISRDPFLLSSSREEHREGNHHYLENSLLKVQICNEQDVVPGLKGNPYIRHSTNQVSSFKCCLSATNYVLFIKICRRFTILSYGNSYRPHSLHSIL